MSYSIFDVVKDTMTGNVQKSEKSKSEERLAICESCDRLKLLNICGECGCYVNTKVLYEKSSCPIGKW